MGSVIIEEVKQYYHLPVRRPTGPFRGVSIRNKETSDCHGKEKWHVNTEEIETSHTEEVPLLCADWQTFADERDLVSEFLAANILAFLASINLSSL
jgi:hypothetical protein